MEIERFIAWSRAAGTLVEIERAVDPQMELARVMYALDGRPVLFRTLTGFPGWRAVSGVCAQRQHFAAALGCTVPNLIHRIADALAHPVPPPVLDSGPCQEVIEERVALTRLPTTTRTTAGATSRQAWQSSRTPTSGATSPSTGWCC